MFLYKKIFQLKKEIKQVEIISKQQYAIVLETSENLRRQAFQDPLTKLGNKRYLSKQLGFLLSRDDKYLEGILFVLQITNFKEYRHHHGYQATESLLSDIAIDLKKNSVNIKPHCIANLGAGEFAILLSNKTVAEIKCLATKIIDGVTSLAVDCNIGISVFRTYQSNREIFASADNALATSMQLGANQFHIDDVPSAAAFMYALDWGKFLPELIAKQEIEVDYQLVLTANNNTLHREALMFLKISSGQLLPENIFAPIAQDLRLMVDIDKIIVAKIIDQIRLTSEKIAVNISVDSLQDKGFVLWLSQQLAGLGLQASLLAVEVAEHIVHDNVAAVKSLFDCVKIYGGMTGLDNFGCGFSSFGYLDKIKVDYIKVDGSYMHNIQDSLNEQYIVSSFAKIAHSLGIKVIATGVDSIAQKQLLPKLQVDGMQG